MRRLPLVLLLCTACDSAPDKAADPAPAPVPTLTADEACAAYRAMPAVDGVVPIAASVIGSTIEATPDGSGMVAKVIELRAESGPVEDGQRKIDGIRLARKLTLVHDGSKWSVTDDKEASRDEIFYLYKTPDVDPKSLFGAQVIERYGPKGGTACELAGAAR